MKDIQEVRTVIGEKRRYQRIRDGFERAVGHRKDESAPIEKTISHHLFLAGRRRESHQGGKNMKRERGNDEFTVTDFVANDPANNDPKAEPGEPRAIDVAKLLAGEAEVSTPVRQNAAADAKADSSSQDRHEACEKQPFCVRNDCFVTD